VVIKYADPASAIPPGEAALVTASGMTELELVLPVPNGNGDLPDPAKFLTACAMRYHQDPAFVARQLRWLANATDAAEYESAGTHPPK
jgi:hypothetical protein